MQESMRETEETIMCDFMDCKDCRHLCKNEINDYEVEKLWEKFEREEPIKSGMKPGDYWDLRYRKILRMIKWKE